MKRKAENMNNKSKKAGFGIVEVMISMLVAMIAFCGVYAMSIQSFRITRLTKDESLSTQAAQYEIEKLRAYSWLQVLALGSSYTVTVSQAGNSALYDLANGSAIIQTAPFPSTSTDAQIRTVSVMVSWDNKETYRSTNTITTLIGRRGLMR